MKRLLLTLTATTAFVIAGCGSDTRSATAPTAAATSDSPPSDTNEGSQTDTGVRLVSSTEAAAIVASPPDDLVILDVRTPEEFAEGHLDRAQLIDFYQADFAQQLADLDPSVPYVLYCRSGNRSGQAADMMRELGFVDVVDVDGGILAWSDAGLPVVTP
mgnify:CR=1 FL=1|jgi:phage shock protein E